VGDSAGNSMIVEGDHIIRKKKFYQVLTNFYQSHPELGGYPCWRYDMAINLFETCDTLTPYLAGEVLASTHQNGNYPTQYSIIFDLQHCRAYLFYFYNFEEFLTIDLHEELLKGYKVYDIPMLFSKTRVLSPHEGEEITTSSIRINWTGLLNSHYEIVYSKHPDFLEYKSVKLTQRLEKIGANHSYALIIFPFASVLSAFLFRKKRSFVFLVYILALCCSNSSCEKDDPAPASDDTVQFSKIIDSLEPNTTYFFKIQSSTGYTDNFHTETVTRSFNTSEKIN